ncbi:hypothetical protein [Actinomadura sp. 3N407]|uniref:hypothetical protein n=1 Tax=Actinomadura sp. 3N407 TaxID=3457423 RepID=UPI003FCE6F99
MDEYVPDARAGVFGFRRRGRPPSLVCNLFGLTGVGAVRYPVTLDPPVLDQSANQG